MFLPQPVVTVNFSLPKKVLVVEANTLSDQYLIHQLGNALNSLKRGESRESNEKLASLPPLDILEKQLKPLPASLVVESNQVDKSSYNNKCLQKLIITNSCKISSKIWSLPHLTQLHLTQCNLKRIPEALVNLKKTLTILDVSNNQIEQIHSTFFLQMHGLKTLNLNHNRLTLIPFEIAFCRSLVSLDISYNLITKLPFTFCTLSKMRELNVSHNQLDHLDHALIHPPTKSKKGNFLSLNTFDFSGNKNKDDQSENKPSNPCQADSNEPEVPVNAVEYFMFNNTGSERIWRSNGNRLQNEPKSNQGGEGRNETNSNEYFPSLMELSGSACLRSLKNFKLFHEWLPRTVHEYLQLYSKLCANCARPSICLKHQPTLRQINWSEFSQAITSDHSSTKIPILDFYCFHCYWKQQFSHS